MQAIYYWEPVHPYWNRKPFRTKAQKAEARKMARRCEDGAWRSPAPISMHAAPAKGQPQNYGRRSNEPRQ